MKAKSYGTDRRLQAAKVFLSHSWKDNKYSDYIFNKLEKTFRVFYDRSSPETGLGLQLGGSVLPIKEIATSDAFIFLASSSAFAWKSRAIEELDVAVGLPPEFKPRTILVPIEDFVVPDRYRYKLWTSIRWHSRKRDTAVLLDRLKADLLSDAGLLSRQCNLAACLVEPEGIERVVDSLLNGRPRLLYALNAFWPHSAKVRFRDLVSRISDEERQQVRESLLRLYDLLETKHALVHQRENAIVLLSMISAVSPELLQQLRRRPPAMATPSLFRGFHVGLALMGDRTAMCEYVARLASSAAREWEAQRKTNKEFHIGYYGGSMATLWHLRQSLERLSPSSLLPMNVYTLGCLSAELRDIELLEERRVALFRSGVDNTVVGDAIRAIHHRNSHERRP